MNLVQKLLFLLWFFGSAALFFLYWTMRDGRVANGIDPVGEFKACELILTGLLGVPFLLFSKEY